MRLSPSRPAFLSCLATAGCLLLPLAPSLAAEPYREETHGPRIGTRILHFFKDLAYGDNPSNRYRDLPVSQRPATPQQRSYGAGPPPLRYSLDQPPQGRRMPQTPPQPYYPPQQQLPPEPGPNSDPRNMASRDMPYDSSEARPPAPERDASQAEVGGRQENFSPIKIKPKKPLTAPQDPDAQKPQVQETPPAPRPAPQKNHLPLEGGSSDTQTVSNSTAAPKKSWSSLTSEVPSTSPLTSPPPVEKKPATTSSSPGAGGNNSNALTGSKTTKDGRVKSPYPPYNELDVTGLPTGSLAMDPTTGKVFRVP